ncbi:MAG: sugar-binding protein [Armatimonadetes bacterium]|nr:sugar-binding protein [Armatimonadota bacterium]
MNFKPQAALLPLALAGLLLAGCHNDNENNPANTQGVPTTNVPDSAKSGGGGGGQAMLAFVTNNPSDYWTICHKGVDKAASDLHIPTPQFIMPDDGTAATQKRDVDDLIAKGVQGIAISPVDPTNETNDINTWAAKVPLITSDSDAANSNRLCYIGTDNHAAGLMAGGLIKEAIPNGGKIMLFVGKSDAQNAKDRIQGIRDALKSDSKYQIIDVRTDDTDHARAKANASDALVKYPDLACLVGIWSYNGPQIYNAVKEAGKAGKVQIVSFDQEQGTMDGIKAGAIYATVVQDPYTFGYKSVTLLNQLAKGDKKGIPTNKMMIVPTQAIKKGNLDTYLADYNKKLGGG